MTDGGAAVAFGRPEPSDAGAVSDLRGAFHCSSCARDVPLARVTAIALIDGAIRARCPCGGAAALRIEPAEDGA